MGSVQRVRGQIDVVVYRALPTTDHRGNVIVRPVRENPHHVRGSVIPDRSARAEVPGEAEINVLTIRVPYRLADVSIRSCVHLWDEWWDLVAPPGDHPGVRHSRHSTLTIRKRPGGAFFDE